MTIKLEIDQVQFFQVRPTYFCLIGSKCCICAQRLRWVFHEKNKTWVVSDSTDSVASKEDAGHYLSSLQ